MKTNNLSPELLVSIPSHRSEAPIVAKIRNVYHDPSYPEEDTIMDWYGNIVEAKDVNPIVITDDFWEKNNFTQTVQGRCDALASHRNWTFVS